MSLWNRGSKPKRRAPPPPPPPLQRAPELLFTCFDPRHFFAEYRADELAFGCPMCVAKSGAPAHVLGALKGKLGDSIRSRLSSPWELLSSQPVNCEEGGHRGQFVRPLCPQCGTLLNKDSTIPGIAIVGISGAGKSVYCAGTYLTLLGDPDFTNRTAITVAPLFDRNDYNTKVMNPLKRDGTMPEKTLDFDFRSVVLSLEKDDPRWKIRRRIVLTDLPGEIYDFATQGAVAGERRLPLTNAKEVIYLISPDRSATLRAGMPAAKRREAFGFHVLNAALNYLKETDRWGALDQQQVRTWFEHAEQVIAQPVNEFPVGAPGAGKGFRSLAIQLLGGLASHSPEMIEGLDKELSDAAAQIDGALSPSQHFKTWKDHVKGVRPTPEGVPIDLNVAIVVTKTDLLVEGDLDLADLAASKIPDPSGLKRLNSTAPRQAWREELDRLSDQAAVALSASEPNLVKLARANFANAGFFYVSAVGRSVMPDLEFTQAEAGGSRGGGVGQAGAARPAADATGWSAETGQKLRSHLAHGWMPRPFNMDAPLLWLLTR